MHKYIPYGRQHIDEDDINAVIDTLKSDFLTTGPKIKEFEEALCRKTDAKYSVAISNGTAALHAACFAAGISEGDEVITTPITFAASANCVLYMKGKPVFADIDMETYNIDPEDIKRKITSKTKAIIPVHFSGRPCDMDEIYKIADKYGLTVIEDAAHALGALYKGRKIGSISDMTTFSFHPVKHITTGEGGAITTNNEELYKKLNLFRTHGITRNNDLMTENQGPWYYEQLELGFNYRLCDIQAALGVSQLHKLDEFVKKRCELALTYNEAFKDIDGLIIPKYDEFLKSSWHIYVIQLELAKLNADRLTIFKELQDCGIGVNVHYIPVYHHPYYKKLGYKEGICPNAEKLYERIITLPLYPDLKKEEIEYVISCVKSIVYKYKK